MNFKRANQDRARWSRWALGLTFLFALGLMGLVGCSSDNATTNTSTEFDDQGALDNLILTELLKEELEEQQETFAKPKKDKADAPESTETDVGTEIQLPPYAQAYGEAVYTDKGFSIHLDFGIQGVGVEFDFPQNAVTDGTADILGSANGVISITGEAVLSCNGSYVFFYECLPHGLEFSSPVLINQMVKEANWTPMGLFYNVLGKWYSLEEVSRVNNGLVKFHLWHFSKYGVSR